MNSVHFEYSPPKLRYQRGGAVGNAQSTRIDDRLLSGSGIAGHRLNC